MSSKSEGKESSGASTIIYKPPTALLRGSVGYAKATSRRTVRLRLPPVSMDGAQTFVCCRWGK